MGFFPKEPPPPPAPVQRSPLPDALRGVDQAALQAYLEAVTVSVAERLRPDVSETLVRQLAAAAISQEVAPAPDLVLRFSHLCKFVGCALETCVLCKHNPNRRCAEVDNFCSTFLEKQALKARCDALIEVQLVNKATGQPYSLAGTEIQLSVIDGHAYNEEAPSPASTIVELLRSDKGVLLLAFDGTGGRAEQDGHITIDLQDGRALLPSSLCIKVTNHVLKTKSFRLLATLVRRNQHGQVLVDRTIKPAVSGRFEVKSNRAATKSIYPHHSEAFTKLKYMGEGSRKALKDVRQCLGLDVPFMSVQTVGELKALVEYADHHKEVENALRELFRFKGEHKERWTELHAVLDQVVLDDNTPRVWYSEDGLNGLLFPCRQGLVHFTKPMALVQRSQEDGAEKVQLLGLDASNDAVAKAMRQQADAAWKTAGHQGWQIFAHPIVEPASASMPVPGPVSGVASGPTTPNLLGGSPRVSGLEALDGLLQESTGSSLPSLRLNVQGAGNGVQLQQHRASSGDALTPLVSPPALQMAPVYPPMQPCDGSFGRLAAQATYGPPQVAVHMPVAELMTNADLADIFRDDDGPFAQQSMSAGAARDVCFGLPGALQHADAAASNMQQPGGMLAGANGAASGPCVGGTMSIKRMRGPGGEGEEPPAALGERPMAARALFHSKSRGRDIRPRIDTDAASIMSDSSVGDVASEDDLTEAMAALGASTSVPANVGMDLGLGAAVPAPAPFLQHANSAPQPHIMHMLDQSGVPANAVARGGGVRTPQAAQPAVADSPGFDAHDFVDNLLKDMGATPDMADHEMKDHEMLLPDFVR